jgi:hypothetical protein
VYIAPIMSRAVSAAFAITGANPLEPATLGREPWVMLVLPDGGMEIAGNGLMLQLGAGRAPVLHDTDGWVAFADAGGSYYYSRTRMPTGGTLTIGGETLAVTGSSWFDHQWGDFIAIGGGGWDWFALNLVRARQGWELPARVWHLGWGQRRGAAHRGVRDRPDGARLLD